MGCCLRNFSLFSFRFRISSHRTSPFTVQFDQPYRGLNRVRIHDVAGRQDSPAIISWTRVDMITYSKLLFY